MRRAGLTTAIFFSVPCRRRIIRPGSPPISRGDVTAGNPTRCKYSNFPGALRKHLELVTTGIIQ